MENGPWWARLVVQGGALTLLGAVLYGIYTILSTLILENALPVGQAVIYGIKDIVAIERNMLEEFRSYNTSLEKLLQRRNVLLQKKLEAIERLEKQSSGAEDYR